MGDIIPFPKPSEPSQPKIQLTLEETHELEVIEMQVKNAHSLREIFAAKRRVKRFIKKVNQRHERESGRR